MKKLVRSIIQQPTLRPYTTAVHKLQQQAYLLWKKGERKKAVEQLSRLISIKPHICLQETTADFLLSQNEFHKAYDLYEHVIQKLQDSYKSHKASLLARIGRCFESINDKKRAKDAFEHALYLNKEIDLQRYSKNDVTEIRTIIIGDVHGCYDELISLLKKCNYRPHIDNLVFVGDILGKGPKQKECIELAMKYKAQCVLGNHEKFVLDYLLSPPNERTFDLPESHAQAKELTEEQIKFIQSWPLYLYLIQFNAIIVHAGLIPNKKLEEQLPNDILSMRDILNDGTGTSKKGVGKPWASVWNENKGPECVIFGHDAARGIQKYDYAIGLDSGACYGNGLTALVLPYYEFVSVPSKMYVNPFKK